MSNYNPTNGYLDTMGDASIGNLMTLENERLDTDENYRCSFNEAIKESNDKPQSKIVGRRIIKRSVIHKEQPKKQEITVKKSQISLNNAGKAPLHNN